jgi:putative ABC transport system permease protein
MIPSARQNVRENLLLALDTLRTHKFRSLLTVLGVLIGVVTVILVASIFAGLDNNITQTVEAFGTRTIYIYKWDPGIHTSRLTREERMRKPLSYEDAQGLEEQCPDVEMVAAENFVNGWGAPPSVRYKNEEMLNAQFVGATPNDFRAINAEVADGRLFNEVDDLHRGNVVVIGADVVTQFFQNVDPIGKELSIDGHMYTIIGTLTKRQQFLGDNGADRVVMIPYHTYMKIYPAARENFLLAVAYPGRMDQAIDEVVGVLRRLRHDKPDAPNSFGYATADSIISQFRQIIGKVVLVSLLVSSIGLMVGGIGVMNIMLVSVTERTREIGVRKAIGARRSDIVWQFLLEAMTLTGAGGLLGVLLGVTLSFLIRTFLPSLPSTVPTWSVLAGFLVSVSIGLFFGMWPALKASRLDPIVALRYE